MIVAAAILKDGVVYTGHRHCDIINKAQGALKGGEQGFVNHEGQFFNRQDAAIEAYKHGQLPYVKKSLYSEDLW